MVQSLVQEGRGRRAGLAGWMLLLLASMAVVPLLVKPAAADGERPVRVLMLGDSLTAGFGLAAEQALPGVLQRLLRAEGYGVELINGGVSGDTMAGGLARLEWLLAESPDIVVVALGANDALRGLPPEQMAQALDGILQRLQADSLPVLLAGMKAPRNLGADYARRYEQVFAAAGRRNGVVFYPFLLEGVALHPELSLDDGLHPNAAGVEEIARRLVPLLRPLVERAARSH